jgi:hypothetical protein
MTIFIQKSGNKNALTGGHPCEARWANCLSPSCDPARTAWPRFVQITNRQQGPSNRNAAGTNRIWSTVRRNGMNCALQTKLDATKIAMEKDSELIPPTFPLLFSNLPGDLGEPAAAAAAGRECFPRRTHERKQGRSGCGGQVRRAKGFTGFYTRIPLGWQKIN